VGGYSLLEGRWCSVGAVEMRQSRWYPIATYLALASSPHSGCSSRSQMASVNKVATYVAWHSESWCNGSTRMENHGNAGGMSLSPTDKRGRPTLEACSSTHAETRSHRSRKSALLAFSASDILTHPPKYGDYAVS
jgi:hypothetical protein